VARYIAQTGAVSARRDEAPGDQARRRVLLQARRAVELVGDGHEGGALHRRDEPDPQPRAARVGIPARVHPAQPRIAELDGAVEQRQVHAAHDHERDRQQGQRHVVERAVMLVGVEERRDLGLAQRDERAAGEHQRHRDGPGPAERAHERAVVADVGALDAVAEERPSDAGEQARPRERRGSGRGTRCGLRD